MPKPSKKKKSKKTEVPEEVRALMARLSCDADPGPWEDSPTVDRREHADHREQVRRNLLKNARSPDEKQREYEEIARRGEEFGLSPLKITGERRKRSPPKPACDSCGLEGGGTKKCGRCQSAFYCSAECQRNDYARHKKECATLKDDVERKAAQVAVSMGDNTLAGHRRLFVLADPNADNPLDVEAVWSLAVQDFDLFDVVEDLLRRERDGHFDAERPYSCGLAPYSVVQHVLTGLFRGQRRRTDGGYNRMDGERLASFFRSSDDAALVLFEDGLRTVLQVADKRVVDDPHTHAHLHRAARDVLNALNLTAANETAVTALFYGGRPDVAEDDEALASFAATRARWLAGLLKKYLYILAALSDDADPNSGLDGLANQLTAILAYWIRRFDVPCPNFPGLCGLAGRRFARYEHMAVPLGEGMAKAGRQLTAPENRAIMQRANARDD